MAWCIYITRAMSTAGEKSEKITVGGVVVYVTKKEKGKIKRRVKEGGEIMDVLLEVIGDAQFDYYFHGERTVV